MDKAYLKDKQRLPCELPEDVLKQLRKHLETLDTTTMRISERCALSLDCLIYDDRHEWYLCSYQRKTKREHINPLINQSVIGAIQAQQQAIISTAWLYGNEANKMHIIHLRLQQVPKAPMCIPPSENASNSSKDTIIAALRQRVKEQEIRDLRKQLEMAFGQFQKQYLQEQESI